AANGKLVGPDNPPVGGDVLVLYASGLGPVNATVASGAAGPSDPLARASRNQRAAVGGFPAQVLFAGLAPGFVGLFQINLQLPDQAAEGDVLQYFSANQMANRLALGSPAKPRVRFLRAPQDATTFTGVTDTALNASTVVVNGPRGGDGCYQNVYVLDFRRNQTTPISDCLVASAPNAQTPFVSENDSTKLAALVGPPVGTPAAGISSKVLILDPVTGRRLIVDLPAPASILTATGAQGGRGLTALLPGDSPRVALINTDTGEVQVTQGGPAGGLGGGGAAGLNVDGLTQVVSQAVRLPGNRTAVVLADSDTNPQRALLVVLASTGDVAAKIAFPDGYLPLLPPRPQAPPGGGGGPGGAGAVGGAILPREGAVYDGQSGRVIVLARAADGSKHALAIFNIDSVTRQAQDFPSGFYAAACSPQLRLFNLALGRKVAVAATDRVETAATTPCASTALLTLDLAASVLARQVWPGSGTVEVSSLGILHDYIYGANADRVTQQNASSLFVYDPASDTVRKLDTPRGATAFAGVQPIAETGQLLALASNRQPGDEGLILFDLAKGTGQLFPAPEGFARLANPAMQTATRKLTARGMKADGSQVVIFDPASGAVTAVPNPEGVQALGAPAAAGGGAGGQGQARVIFDRNQNANTILATAYAGDRAVGLVLIEAP
ncbi:MAG: hypothetical protein HY238_09505, partial [Acidobacteria bacterium]|nr:hypothetical protein [Acidobacteriota bacterium]